MPRFQLDHVAVAVHEIDPALKLFGETLGGSYAASGDSPGGWRWHQVAYPGGGRLELLQPLAEGFLTRFLDRRGEGLHHVTFKTDDIRAAIGRAEENGYQMVDVNLEHPGWMEAFFRPSLAHGTLIQIAQSGDDL